MSVFSMAKKLCSWAGLTPQNAESAGKKKTTRIGRAGAYLKPLLVQCAIAAGKSDKHPEIKSKYQTLKYRRGGKKATIAIARRLLTAVFHIISKSEPYNAELYHTSDIAPISKVISQDQAFKLALRMGYSVEGYEPPPKPDVEFDPPAAAT
jgi:hypothetical protein